MDRRHQVSECIDGADIDQKLTGFRCNSWAKFKREDQLRGQATGVSLRVVPC